MPVPQGDEEPRSRPTVARDQDPRKRSGRGLQARTTWYDHDRRADRPVCWPTSGQGHRLQEKANARCGPASRTESAGLISPPTPQSASPSSASMTSRRRSRATFASRRSWSSPSRVRKAPCWHSTVQRRRSMRWATRPRTRPERLIPPATSAVVAVELRVIRPAQLVSVGACPVAEVDGPLRRLTGDEQARRQLGHFVTRQHDVSYQEPQGAAAGEG